MVVVSVESYPHPEMKQAYLETGARLASIAQDVDGFISIERFESLTTPGKLLAVGTFRDEYRLRVATVLRDYSMKERSQVPEGPRKALG